MKRAILFVHGGGGGAYEADATLADNLRHALGGDHDVRYPEMPDEEAPDYQVWRAIILHWARHAGQGAIVVGHSIGASVVIKLLTDADAPTNLGGAFLIAAPFWHDHEIWTWDDVALATDATARYPANVALYFYQGEADQTVPLSHLAMYEQAFPQARTRRLLNRDHQLNGDLGEIARDIENLC
ncbi:MAG TPA: alpha/beta fold hydrolase [Verrucomicrobiae bacterium]|nr:alpha/beta fold hydrolase [Verrucomicrobiae bacterium]